MHVGILGGTGPAGRGVAVRLAEAGVRVTIGSRDAERAERVVADVVARWPGADLDVHGADNEEAAAAELVVVATPWDSAVATVRSLRDPLSGKVVVSMANALVKEGREMLALIPPRGSVAAAVQAALPDSLVAAAFHHLPASEMEDLESGLEADVLVCADHPEATAATVELVAKDARAAAARRREPEPGRRDRGVHRGLHHPQHPPQGAFDAEDPRYLAVRLYDTARREVVAFEPGPMVTMYSCGITPYDAAHLGHAAVYLYFDMLQRRLQDAGHETKCVRNVTDVDDDILRKARELGVHYLDLAAEEMARFDAEMGLLNLLPVYSEPRATSAISEILSLIGEALEGGHAYESGGSVYFSVASFADFGRISGYDRAHMLVLAAEHGGRPDDPNKRDPLDFVLWQPSLPDEPAWESRWGPGRPGWHIECSALVLRELGETIDIHGGGRDLVFPHHECETAQSESVTGKPFVRLWFHVGLVGLHGTKMSKSLGNLVFVGDLCKEWDPAAVRLALLAHHYREDWDWRTDEDMPAAAARVALWRSAPAGDGRAGLSAVRAALDDDLDTPAALRALDEEATAGRPVVEGARLLGIDL